jgi:hypothetical protein
MLQLLWSASGDWKPAQDVIGRTWQNPQRNKHDKGVLSGQLWNRKG